MEIFAVLLYLSNPFHIIHLTTSLLGTSVQSNSIWCNGAEINPAFAYNVQFLLIFDIISKYIFVLLWLCRVPNKCNSVCVCYHFQIVPCYNPGSWGGGAAMWSHKLFYLNEIYHTKTWEKRKDLGGIHTCGRNHSLITTGGLDPLSRQTLHSRQNWTEHKLNMLLSQFVFFLADAVAVCAQTIPTLWSLLFWCLMLLWKAHVPESWWPRFKCFSALCGRVWFCCLLYPAHIIFKYLRLKQGQNRRVRKEEDEEKMANISEFVCASP